MSEQQPAEPVVDLEDHDEEDVARALEAETDDGPGNLEELPESDFDGFASDDVEEDE